MKANTLQASLRLTRIYNSLRELTNKQVTMDKIKPSEFSELVDIRSEVHNAIMESLTELNSKDSLQVLDDII